MNERREIKRFQLNLLAKIYIDNGNLPKSGRVYMTTSDISARGVYLLTDLPLPIATRVRIDIFLPIQGNGNGNDVSMLQLTGSVNRSGKDGMAVLLEDTFEIFALC